jgi:hypothetical protein
LLPALFSNRPFELASTVPIRRLTVLLALVAPACGTPPQTTELRNAVATTARAAVQGVALRFAGGRAADVRLYELPGLDEVSWRFDTPGLVAERLVGFAPDEDLGYALTPARQLVALDLATGRARPADTLVRAAAVGPDGSVLLVHVDGSLATLSGRRAVPVGKAEGAEVEAVFGGTAGRLVAVLRGDSGRSVAVSASGSLAAGRPLPDGPMAVSPWGDAVAVATDTGLVLMDLLRDVPPRQTGVRGVPQAVAFSSSGHRIYVATDRPALMMIDRFTLARLGNLTLPAPVTELRRDLFGGWLLGKAQDSIAVIPQGAGDVRMVPGGWDHDLPAGAPDGTLLIRRGDDVMALDRETLEPRGRVRGGADDRWLAVQWDPRRPALQVTTPAAAGGTETASQELYVQVSSTTNHLWADDQAQQLRVAGLRATVLPPEVEGEPYRVVIGPYRTREEAEEIGRTLGQAFWIFTRDASPRAP